MMERLRDKVAIVTGVGGGIGRATALRFASEGARVAALDIQAEALAELASCCQSIVGGQSGKHVRRMSEQH